MSKKSIFKSLSLILVRVTIMAPWST